MNQWQAAALQPPHLAAICIWEGAADYYRDLSHHGGILCTFGRAWFPSQVIRVQHGRGTRGYRSRMNGEWVSGPLTLTEEELGASRREFYEDCGKHPLASDEYWRSRMPDWSKITVPLFSSANWGGQGLHPRGNFEGFVRATSRQKWLEVHGIEHWTHFYTDYGVGLQKKFFGHFLKGEDTGWRRQPKVMLQVRHLGEKFVERHEGEWPLARTRWTKLYLNPADCSLVRAPVSRARSVRYGGLGDGVTFLTPPLPNETEIVVLLGGRRPFRGVYNTQHERIPDAGAERIAGRPHLRRDRGRGGQRRSGSAELASRPGRLAGTQGAHPLRRARPRLPDRLRRGVDGRLRTV
jgi:hypothetical protein